MKRKPTPSADLDEDLIDPVEAVSEEIVGTRPGKCSVCGGESAPNSAEGLCWVCRRLKISAWRDNDSQAAVQE